MPRREPLLERCQDKTELNLFLSASAELQLYGLGDLDPFFWPFTRYYVKRENSVIVAVVIVYQTTDLPIVMALGDNIPALISLLSELLPTLGERIYCHLSFGCEATVLAEFNCTYSEHQGRMILKQPRNTVVENECLIEMGPNDAERLKDFFQLSYPSNWFDPAMLNCHPFIGYVHNHQLVSVAGIHVFSPEYKVAALGNITTHPDFRGQGFASLCTAALNQQLMSQVELIGLNVHMKNTAAIRSYEKVGFELTHRFAEMMLERKQG